MNQELQKTTVMGQKTRQSYFVVRQMRPHVAEPVKNIAEELKWQALPHPPYTPDISPSHCYLFP